jgi:pyruvate kinase
MARCLNGVKLGEKKNMNLPGATVDLPTLTEKDEKDLVDFGIEHGVDFIAASFVRKASDLDYIRDVLGPKGANIKIISWLPEVILVWKFHQRRSSLLKNG